MLGILSDTHDEIERTRAAVDALLNRGATAFVHCGDVIGEEIIAICSQRPSHFVFGNHDADMVGILKDAAERFNATCLGWGGEFELMGKRIAVTHGHLTIDLQPLIDKQPDYLLSGHFHQSRDWMQGKTRRIVPGALHRADIYSVATLNLETDQLDFIEID